MSVAEIFWDKVFIVRNTVKKENLNVWLLSVENEALLTCMQFHLIVVSIFSKT